MKKLLLSVLLIILTCSFSLQAQNTYPLGAEKDSLTIDRKIVRVGEEFTISLQSGLAADKWQIFSVADSMVVAEAENTPQISATLSKEGFYDLRIEKGKVKSVLQGAVLAAGVHQGKAPEITSLDVKTTGNGAHIYPDEPVTVRYRAHSDGTGDSRGMRIGGNGGVFYIPYSKDLEFLNDYKFTLCGWFNFDEIDRSSDFYPSFVNIRNMRDGETGFHKLYGMFSSLIGRDFNYIDITCLNGRNYWHSTEYPIRTHQWYHWALALEFNPYDESSDYWIHMIAYFNGIKYLDIETNQVYLKFDTYREHSSISVGDPSTAMDELFGTLDDFKIYDKILTTEEVKASMLNEDLDSDHLMAYWDFESDADEEGAMLSKGVFPDIKAYAVHRILDAQDFFTFNDSIVVKKQVDFVSGAPLLPNTVSATPTWQIEGAEVVGQNHQAGMGEVTLAYPAAGKYAVKVNLLNEFGESPEREVFIDVTDPVGIDKENITQAYEAFPNPFYNKVNVRFSNPGLYTIKVFNTTGALIQQNDCDVKSDLTVPVSVDGETGTYFIQIVHKEKILQALKVIKQG